MSDKKILINVILMRVLLGIGGFVLYRGSLMNNQYVVVKELKVEDKQVEFQIYSINSALKHARWYY